MFYRVTKEEQREGVVTSENISNLSSVRNETVYTTTETPEMSNWVRWMSAIGLRSAEDEDRMIGKKYFYNFCCTDRKSLENFTDIYIFTAITVATVLITLSRSFLFFSVS